MSGNKITSEIEKITLNAATFNGVEITPTLINFFYGNNGTGKSTIAQAISKGEGGAWKPSKTVTDYSVLVYNQDFVTANFENYGNLRGVFTVGEQNIEIQKQVAEKAEEKAKLDKAILDGTTEKGRKETAKETLFETFQESCWDKTEAIRKGFDATQVGNKRKVQFAERVLQIANPTHHNLDALRELYNTAFDVNARTYKEFQLLGVTTRLKGSKASELLLKPIVSSSDTPFADFMKALNATDWVRQGHERFAEADGKCPYCQRKLPDNFEEDITACFDGQYQQDLDDLSKFLADYESDMQGFVDTLKANLQDAFPKFDLTEYNDKLALFENQITLNIQRIRDKVKEPSSTVALDNVRPLREGINDIIEAFNKQVQEHNAVVNAKQKNQGECKAKVWEHIAYMLQSDVSAYKKSLSTLSGEITALGKKIAADSEASKALGNEMAALNKKVISTKPTIDSINNLLRDSGFQGFSIREKKGKENVYEIVRSNGNVADNLSEGERNFIAFLYFYHLVRGSHSDSDTKMDKIVVIDDPVSSMDSSVLFIVSTLVREMVEVCYANVCYWDDNIPKENYIKQIFVLTHNVYFHKEISYNQVGRYNYVSFFVINKTSNISTIKLCERQSMKRPTDKENYNPIQNSYAALWSEYKELNTPVTVLNIIRRILEYYFIQLCGYDGVDIRSSVLDDNKNKFISESEDCLPDYSKYNLASTMLSYINASSLSLTDGLYFVDDSIDIVQCKEVFKLIFETLNQGQHYIMMMGDNAS